MRTTIGTRLLPVGSLLLVAATAFSAAACASRSVNQILADPTRYRDREIHLSGDVVDSYSLADRGVYRIDDGTGRLWVVSDRGVPRRGAHVSVRGTIREGYNLGSIGDAINLPREFRDGLVLIESSHKAKD